MGNVDTRPPSPPPVSHSSGKPLCVSCQSKEEDLISWEAACDHLFCEPCLRQMLDTTIEKRNRSYVTVKCPWSRCKKCCPLPLVKKFSSEKSMEIVNREEKQLPKIDGLAEDLKENEMPFTLADFGYKFNEKGELRSNDGEDRRYFYINERHYDAMGELIVKHIQKEMMEKHDLKEYFVDEESKVCNVFRSENKHEKLIILIQGTGAVRAGQWARALCFNDNLDSGSNIPYLKQALEEKYDVVIFNPNLNEFRKVPEPPSKRFDWTDPIKPGGIPENNCIKIKGCENMVRHTITAFDKFVKPIMKKNGGHVTEIYIVAHSAGGRCTLELLDQRKNDLLDCLVAIGFTDSVHGMMRGQLNEEVSKTLKEKAINWSRSRAPLDHLISMPGQSASICRVLSAGHEKHENTSASCQTSLFQFLKKMSDERNV